MRPTHAKDHPATAPPRPVAAVSGASLPCRPPACGGRERYDEEAYAVAGAPFFAGAAEVREADADVPGAVGRTLDGVLAERLRRARSADPLFAEELAERVARFTLKGGKRTRAQLVWWAVRACAGRDPVAAAAALRIGSALELLQTCALVHDDVMDRAAVRRGRPALHVDLAGGHAGRVGDERAERFGQSAAVLAGDLALAWADDLVAETPLPSRTAMVVRRLWSDMRTEMVAGQYLDVRGQIAAAWSLPRVRRAACLKSALYSVGRPLALGAAAAGADDVTARRLGDAGRCVGMAFQLRDDVDDVFGDPRETGKACGGDIREGKPTYLLAVARARAEAAGDGAALAVLERWLGDAALTGRGLEQVRDVLVGTGARDAVESRIDRLAARGLWHFDRAALDTEGSGPLRALLLATAGARPDGTGADGARADGTRVNGARTNGARAGGAQTSEAPPDGARTNDARADSARTDGARTNEAPPPDCAGTNEAPLHRARTNGTRVNGARADGPRTNEAPPDRAGTNEGPPHEARPNGTRVNGARVNEARASGAQTSEAPPDGARKNNARSDGTRADGAWVNGTRADGARVNEARTSGVRADAVPPDEDAVRPWPAPSPYARPVRGGAGSGR
ncbi:MULTISPECIES: polyprenyl synthetase family protein [unclassified Streptomyces]|uniref:polyprenyl synthetase family protein n=1 Tax=unclassified Streptomyces TaxID=2593676 RepID=UPI000DC23E32|nr:geranylgeranyl diphosphate synthase type I [Streptomyces sp. PsTaAH-130]